jgi:hypothetical protein
MLCIFLLIRAMQNKPVYYYRLMINNSRSIFYFRNIQAGAFGSEERYPPFANLYFTYNDKILVMLRDEKLRVIQPDSAVSFKCQLE